MKRLVERYGSWALVAGASEGLGAAFATELAQAGFSLVLLARRAAALETLAADLRKRFDVVVEVKAIDLGAVDLEEQMKALATEREIGLLVYNAAYSIIGGFLDTSIADKQKILDVNTRGPLICAHVFGEAMAARGRGGIVLLSSLTAFWGSAWVATYGATKAFNLSLGEALAQELGDRGVDVIVSCAGATRTPNFVQALAGQKGPSAMLPEDVARETLEALPKRGAFVPGGFNRFAQFLMTRLMPRKMAVKIMAGQTRSLLDRAKPGGG